MHSHAEGQVLADMAFDIVPIPNTTVDSEGNIVRTGGMRVKTDALGQFSVSLATGENLYYSVRRSYGVTPFDPITFAAPTSDGGTIDLADVIQVIDPYPNSGTTSGGKGIASMVNDSTDPSKVIITYTDGSTGSLILPTGDVNSVNGMIGDVTLTASSVGAKPSSYTPTWSEITSKPAAFPPSAHTHAITAVTGLQAALDLKANVADVPTTPADIGAQPAGSYATGAQGALADSAVQPADLATVATSGSYTDLSNKPTIPPAPTWSTLSGKPAVIAAGDTAALARTAIGAGTSNLALGSTSSTAKAGNWKPSVADIPAGSVLTVAISGTVWPARPTSRTDVTVWWVGGTERPPGAIVGDIHTPDQGV